MSKIIMIGCDLHDVSMLLKIAEGAEAATTKSFLTAEAPAMIAWVQDFAAQRQASRIVFAYEASGLGFGLHDDLRKAGIECHVLAPTHLPHTPYRRRNKTDEKDALMILDEVRAHVLAGKKLPKVWVPDAQTRDDREIVRMRLEIAEQRTRIKNQIRHLAKRSRLEFPVWFSKSGEWSRRSMKWLAEVVAGEAGSLGEGARAALMVLVQLYNDLRAQLKAADKAIVKLSKTDRYNQACRKLKLFGGVGLLTAMVFLTELGDLNRFANRRQLGAYLGMAPSAYESGEVNDRKGHITHQGPARIRQVLGQAAWAAVRCSERWRNLYMHIRRGSKKRSKIAIVAVMRRLAISLWQAARSPELAEVLEEIDRQKRASAQARQKGAALPSSPSLDLEQGEGRGDGEDGRG